MYFIIGRQVRMAEEINQSPNFFHFKGAICSLVSQWTALNIALENNWAGDAGVEVLFLYFVAFVHYAV
jgi:hypothetical protein